VSVASEGYAPKHRSVPPAKHRAERAPKAFTLPKIPAVTLPAAFSTPVAKRLLVASSIAVAATGVAVSTGVAGAGNDDAQLTSVVVASGSQATSSDISADRTQEASRSLDRTALAQTAKTAALSTDSGTAITQTADLVKEIKASGGGSVEPGTLKAVALKLMPSYGLSPSEFSCVDRIWTQESHWNPHAANPSGAYGIPQAVPGSKMASVGADWQTNPTTQIKWGLGYIKNRYGTACNAAAFKFSHGWY